MTDKRIWELLAKQFDGEITAEELQELEALLGRQSEKAPYGELLSDLHGLRIQPDLDDRLAREKSLTALRAAMRNPAANGRTDLVEAFGPDMPFENPSTDMRTRIRWAIALTAILLILPVAWYLLKTSRMTGAANETARTETLDKIVTKTGSKTLISLPDSSTVVLSSACQFSYNKDFGVRKREMHLTGEAYFEIHSNPEMPLIVHAGNVLIRVLGTTFNVRANQDDSFVEASLINGAIEVSLRSDPERKILLRPGEKIQIRQDTLLTPGHSRNPTPDMITVSKIPPTGPDSSYVQNAWQREKMLFHKESFGSLIKQMESRYEVRIALTDTSLRSWLFTGSFDKENIDEALQALQNTAPFNYSKNGGTITITRRKL